MFQVSVIKNNTEAQTLEFDKVDGFINLLDNTHYPDGVSPIIFKNNRRESDNFLEASLTCLDFDGTLGKTEDEARVNLENMFSEYNAIIKTSRNHLKEKQKGNKVEPALPRYHVWLQLEDKVQSPEEYQATYIELLKQFPTADPTCKDVARQFYGNGKVVRKFAGKKKVKIVQPIKIEKPEVDTVIPSGARGILSAKTSDFLVRGYKGNGWHNETVPVIYDMKAQGYSEDEVIKALERIAPEGALDSADMFRIHDIFSKRSPKIEFRKEDKIHPHTLMDVTEQFKERAKNIDQNVIKTGIESLDEKMIIETGSGVGLIGAAACHAKGTEILLYNGSIKNVEDVRVGDLLMGPDSKPREVLKLHRGKEEMIKIIPKRTEPFIVNKSHILHLEYSEKISKTISCDLNIKVSDFIEKSSKCFKGKYKLKTQGVEFDTSHQLPIDPYILGIWLGDGTSSKPEICSMDQEVIDAWIEYGSTLGLLPTIQQKPNNKAKSISLTTQVKGGLPSTRVNTLTNLLKQFNLLGNKHIPEIYLTSPVHERYELLAGLLDTDGFLSNGKQFDFIQKDENLAKQVTRLARSLGLHVSINKTRKGCYTKHDSYFEGDYYRLYIAGDCHLIPNRVPRRKAKKLISPRSCVHQGFSWEYLPEDDYYGFTIDGDHLYLTGDFIIHHNSGKSALALEMLTNTSKAGIKSVFGSLDMHKQRMYEKAMYRVNGISRDELYRAFQEDREKPYVDKLKENFKNVYFYSKSSPTVKDIRDYVIDCEQQSGEKIKLVMLDYFERVSSDFSDDTQASKKVAGELQDLVNDLGVALVTIVQPNKMALSGGVDSPLYDYTKIKGSSYLYQSFRQIISIWRPGYNPKEFHNDRWLQMAILKNDLGELAEFAFKWDGRRGSITEMEEHDYDALEQFLAHKEDHKKQSGDGWN